MLVSLWLLMMIHLLRSMIITTHTRLFSSFFSIYIVLISSLLCFPRPVYVLLPELLSRLLVIGLVKENQMVQTIVMG